MPLYKLRAGHVWEQQLIGCSQSFCQSEQSLTLFPSLTGVVPTMLTISVQDDLAVGNTLPLNQQFPAGVLYLTFPTSTSLTHRLFWQSQFSNVACGASQHSSAEIPEPS